APPAVADLVVLIDRGAADAAAADPVLAQDVPHLSVVVRESSILVGPLVVPGHGPCLRCLDLHRSERDPQWPLVLAQLVSSAAARSAPRAETASAHVAAGLAALQVLGQLDGRHTPSALGATLEIELPDGLISRRPWPAHPACGCHWPPAATRDVTRGRTRVAVHDQ
ncbi:MAG TPA: TOMM precursor leader peptide-binding protein, partial [Kineosporiaceae bacterium]|nr:TOMM precursor leader peptide-binding protein [Kineosporiaceae bacterium]